MSPAVRVCSVWATVDANGSAINGVCVEEVPALPEHAHRLAEAPEVSVTAVAASTSFDGRMLVDRWMVAALGFIEAEAVDAYQAAVEELRLTPWAYQRRTFAA